MTSVFYRTIRGARTRDYRTNKGTPAVLRPGCRPGRQQRSYTLVRKRHALNIACLPESRKLFLIVCPIPEKVLSTTAILLFRRSQNTSAFYLSVAGCGCNTPRLRTVPFDQVPKLAVMQRSSKQGSRSIERRLSRFCSRPTARQGFGRRPLCVQPAATAGRVRTYHVFP